MGGHEGQDDRGIAVSVIDLHAQVLPGIDDGPPDMEGSVALALALVADGTHTVAATPHARADHPRVRLSRLEGMCEELERRLPPGTDLTVVPAAECDLAWAQEASDDQLRLASLGQRGRDLLLETPYGPLPPTFEDLLFRVSLRGYRILLAHPERSRTFQADPERLTAIVRRGVLVQVTALSLASANRRSRTRAFAHSLVERGLAHVIASDAHSAAGKRAPLSAGLAAAARVDAARAEWMVTEAPAAVLAGEPLPRPPRRPAARRGLLQRIGLR